MAVAALSIRHGRMLCRCNCGSIRRVRKQKRAESRSVAIWMGPMCQSMRASRSLWIFTILWQATGWNWTQLRWETSEAPPGNTSLMALIRVRALCLCKGFGRHWMRLSHLRGRGRGILHALTKFSARSYSHAAVVLVDASANADRIGADIERYRRRSNEASLRRIDSPRSLIW